MVETNNTQYKSDTTNGNFAIRLINISKHFGGLYAVDNVSLDVKQGEVLALLGDNGAGKSTLIKVLSGVHRADHGKIQVNEKDVRIESPNDAKALGIETIYQDLSLMNNLDIPSNIFMGREICTGILGKIGLLSIRNMQKEAENLLDRFNIIIPDVKRRVEALSGGQRQMVAICRAIYFNAKIIIMDEPTAALGVSETEKVYRFIDEMKKQNLTIILISHNIEEIFDVADRFAVMKAGKFVGIRDRDSTKSREIVRMIISGNDAG